ncbi:hypothetical protein GCM10007092_12810 [Thermus composti]|uniref:Uncharacterized protein n=1 Tax=Thermus composti TaxID=532059 RepID=A0ABV6Q2X1_9DEIN|nr:hypothetical protein [Thermus composti]GGN00225.1 hypothetical protein GCM10007092_12810 [Thermus composti]
MILVLGLRFVSVLFVFRALAEGILRALEKGAVPVYPKELEFPFIARRFAVWYEKVRGKGVADQ